MNILDRKFMLFCFSFFVCVSTSISQADTHKPLICSVSGSLDDFKVYPNQLVYSSDEFTHYQLIDGLTVLVVNKKTMRFNRLSNLNLLPNSTMDPNDPPENYQLFSGACEYSQPSTN